MCRGRALACVEGGGSLMYMYMYVEGGHWCVWRGNHLHDRCVWRGSHNRFGRGVTSG